MKQIIEIDWKMQEKNDQTSNQQFRNTVIWLFRWNKSLQSIGNDEREQKKKMDKT